VLFLLGMCALHGFALLFKQPSRPWAVLGELVVGIGQLAAVE